MQKILEQWIEKYANDITKSKHEAFSHLLADLPQVISRIEQELVESGKVTETTERIVIDYANLSGRETANRAEFRKLVDGHIRTLLHTYCNKE